MAEVYICNGGETKEDLACLAGSSRYEIVPNLRPGAPKAASNAHFEERIQQIERMNPRINGRPVMMPYEPVLLGEQADPATRAEFIRFQNQFERLSRQAKEAMGTIPDEGWMVMSALSELVNDRVYQGKGGAGDFLTLSGADAR